MKPGYNLIICIVICVSMFFVLHNYLNLGSYIKEHEWRISNDLNDYILNNTPNDTLKQKLIDKTCEVNWRDKGVFLQKTKHNSYLTAEIYCDRFIGDSIIAFKKEFNVNNKFNNKFLPKFLEYTLKYKDIDPIVHAHLYILHIPINEAKDIHVIPWYVDRE